MPTGCEFSLMMITGRITKGLQTRVAAAQPKGSDSESELVRQESHTALAAELVNHRCFAGLTIPQPPTDAPQRCVNG